MAELPGMAFAAFDSYAFFLCEGVAARIVRARPRVVFRSRRQLMSRNRVILAVLGVAFFLWVGTVQAGDQLARNNQPAQPADPAPMTDEEFVKKAALGGLAEVELGNLAMQKGAS